MASGRKLDPEIIAAIEALAAEGHGPTEIQRRLRSRFPGEPADLRTIQRYVRLFRLGDAEETWTLEPGAPRADFIVGVLAEVIRWTEGRVTQFNKGVAAWLVTVNDAAPDLHSWTTYRLARAYFNRWVRQLPATDLDQFLAFAPWRGEANQRAYEAAIAKEWVRRAPVAMNDASRIIVAAAQMGSTQMPPNVDPEIWDELRGAKRRMDSAGGTKA